MNYLQIADEFALHEHVVLLQIVLNVALAMQQHVELEHVVLHVADALFNAGGLRLLAADLTCGSKRRKKITGMVYFVGSMTNSFGCSSPRPRFRSAGCRSHLAISKEE